MPEQSTPEHPHPAGCCAPQKPNTTLPQAHVSSKATYLALLEAGDLRREQLWQPPLQLSRPRGNRCVPQASWMEVQAPKIEVSKAGGRSRGHRAAPPLPTHPQARVPPALGLPPCWPFPGAAVTPNQRRPRVLAGDVRRRVLAGCRGLCRAPRHPKAAVINPSGLLPGILGVSIALSPSLGMSTGVTPL